MKANVVFGNHRQICFVITISRMRFLSLHVRDGHWSRLTESVQITLLLHPNSSDELEQFSVAMAEMATLSLASICLDVQIGICMFLHPSDILALRKVCRHQKFSLLKSVESNLLLSRHVKLFNLAPGNA